MKEPFGAQQARKIKKVQGIKLVKSNKSIFFPVKLHFWQFFQFKNRFLDIFEIAKNGIR